MRRRYCAVDNDQSIMSHGLKIIIILAIYTIVKIICTSMSCNLDIPILPPEGGPRMDTLPTLVGVWVP